MDRVPRVKKKDRTGVFISIAAHAVVIGIALFILSRTEVGRQLWERTIGATRDEKKAPPPKKEPPKPTTKAPPKTLDSGPKSTGPRRTATEAPPAVGESFFSESEEKKGGAASGGEGARTNVVVMAIGPPPKPPPPPRLFASAAPKSDIKQLYVQRAKEAAATESFGTEQISKSGASDAGAIVNKIAGATIVEGKFAVIRGLSDRYVTTTFNGGEIPSADPYRRAASLDMFPAQIIDKVVVAKTFTPDQQGAYTGGGINIVSKSFPEKGFVTVSLGSSYNSQATGNGKFLTYDGGGLDWAGKDDGTRALPGPLSAPGLTLPPAPNNSGLPSNPNYNRNIQNAETLNTDTKLMGTAQFTGVQKAPPPNYNFSLAAGDTTHLFGNPFGVFVSASYRHDYRFYDDGIQRRYQRGVTAGVYDISKNYSDTVAVEAVNWNAMVALAYQPWMNHVVAFNYLHNQNSDNLVRYQTGTQVIDPGRTFYLNRLQWTERALDTFQLRGTHEFPDLAGVKFDWLGVYSTTSQDEPDVRFFNYSQIGGNYEVGHASNPEPRYPTRYYRNLEENNVNAKGDLTVPFRQWSGLDSEFKTGGFYSQSERTFTDREIYYLGDAPFNGDPNQYLTPNNLGYLATTNSATRRITYDWLRYIQTRESSYDGTATIPAAYLMLDMPVTEPDWSWLEKVRLVGGVRYEVTDMTVNSQSYQANSITGQRTNTSVINQVDWLPAAGLILSLRSNMNLRLHYSETVARPSFRELAAYRSYDPVLDETLEGNPNLTMSSSQNFDIRWEWFFAPGELVSVGFFYKKLTGPIERFFVTLDQDIVSFLNRDNGTAYGIEFEGRKSLGFLDHALENFTFGGNVSLISSETQLTDVEYENKKNYVPDVSRTRQLYDQSPYIINLDLSYDNPGTGTSASLLYNIAGPRITIASLTTEDVFEQPAPVLDFVISQKLGRHLSVRFSARNLLNPLIERTYGEDSNLIYSSHKRGRTYGLSLSYDF